MGLAGLKDGEAHRLEAEEVRAVMGGEGGAQADAGGGDEAIGQTATAASRGVEKVGGA